MAAENKRIMGQESDKIDTYEFDYEKKGYRKSQVREYIAKISTELDNTLLRVSELENEILEINLKLEEYEIIDKEIRNALVFLKESEKETLIKTQDEVTSMLKEAGEKSDQIISDAEEEAKSTRDTLLFLKEQQEILIARLKIIIDSQEGMLNDFSMGKDTSELQKSMAETFAFKSQTELNINSILEKLL